MGFDLATINAVWGKGQTVTSNKPSEFRKDECGAWIYRPAYGNRESQYGWEIDHIKPVDHGGSDQLISNLRPLQWGNNSSRGSDRRLDCVITANGTNNGSA